MMKHILGILVPLLIVGALVVGAVFGGAAVYLSVIAIGLALALQKYVSSYFGYFVIIVSGIFRIGDRIRIGSFKGDVRHVGFLHFTLDEVGEDEKLGGELTGRVLHIPNLIVLDQPVLNFSKGYSEAGKTLNCDYIFDEIRVALTSSSNVAKAAKILEDTIASIDTAYVEEAKTAFKARFPSFLKEAESAPRVLIHLEPQRVWLKGKFVCPYRIRNQLRTLIYMRFLERITSESDIRLA